MLVMITGVFGTSAFEMKHGKWWQFGEGAGPSKLWISYEVREGSEIAAHCPKPKFMLRGHTTTAA